MNKKGTSIVDLANSLLTKTKAENVLKNTKDIILVDNFPEDVDEELEMSEKKMDMYNELLTKAKNSKIQEK